MNFVNALKSESHKGYTENGAIVYDSTLDSVYDLFAKGGSMRQASESDIKKLFADAYIEDPTMALRCLCYLRDIRGGLGERRTFRTILTWLVANHPKEVEMLIPFIPEFGRWDDLYTLNSTGVEKAMYKFMYDQFKLDMRSKTPSLLGKWLKSTNTSSINSCALGRKTCEAFDLDERTYRKALSTLRERIKVVERLMSQGRWDEIEFDKIPSGAGFRYRNAFARNDVLKERYKDFVEDDTKHFHADTLYPYQMVCEALENARTTGITRESINKYWADLKNYFDERDFNALVVCDTSGSMTCGRDVRPIDVAISLALYAADKCKGPFRNHFISFSSRPQLIETKGQDFVAKCKYIESRNLCENTNIEATFDLILNTAIANHMHQSDLPERLIIISDMQFDAATGHYSYPVNRVTERNTLMETIQHKWEAAGYNMPHLVFWNVNGSYENSIPMLDENLTTYVSGASPTIFEMVASNKTGRDLMIDKLNSERYSKIHSVE